MRAARLHDVGKLDVTNEPVPAPGSGESLVRVTSVGICGSDLHWHSEGSIGDARLESPLVLGHEFAGIVEAGPYAGRRVAVDPAIPCGHCTICLLGQRNLCPAVRFAGHGRDDGALRDYVAWPDTALHPIPDSVSDADGAMLEPLGVAIHALDLGHVRVAAEVAIVGCGPIGLLLVQAVRAAGGTVAIAVDPLAHRREAARRFGALRAVDVDSEPEALADLAPGFGVDVAFEVAGVDDAVDRAMHLVRPGGRVVLAGIPSVERTSFPAALARRKGLTMAMSRRMKDVYPRAIRMVQQGLVDVRSLVTARYPLDRVGDAFDLAATRQGLKIIVDVSSSAGGQ